MPRKPSVIRDAKDVYEAFKGISRHKRERMYSILLDGESVLGIENVSKGSEWLVDSPPDEVYMKIKGTLMNSMTFGLPIPCFGLISPPLRHILPSKLGARHK